MGDFLETGIREALAVLMLTAIQDMYAANLITVWKNP
jgi:hypothetical protein